MLTESNTQPDTLLDLAHAHELARLAARRGTAVPTDVERLRLRGALTMWTTEIAVQC